MIERKQVATQWDMGWFCVKCDKLHHWKELAYMVNHRPYCEECAKKEELKNGQMP